jgi:hypothetical protein
MGSTNISGDSKMNYLNRGKRNLLVIISLVFSLSGYLVAEEKTTPVSYDLKVSIEPEQGSLAVQAKLEIPQQATRDFIFDLHETFAIKKMLVNGKDAEFSVGLSEFSPMKPASKRITVHLTSDTTQEKVPIYIEYNGRLKEIPEFGTVPDQKQALDDQINSRMIELAGYSSWFPQVAFGQPLQVELDLSLPQNWISICSGKKIEDRIKEGRAVTHWSSPKDIDIVILASPNYKKKSIRQSGVLIETYHTRMPEKFIELEFQQIVGVLELFKGYLGETNIPAGTVKHVYSPKRKGQGMAGFVRPGLIVTSEGLTMESLAENPRFSLFQGIAHEIAHFWWNFGVAQGDWINESFAEFFSAVAVQKIVTEEEFENTVANYKKQVAELPADAPSLATVPFLNDEAGFIVRYYKGALMLNRLREILGEKKFLQACRDFFQTCREKPTGTVEFRNFWKEKLRDQANLLDVWLDSRGGIPD